MWAEEGFPIERLPQGSREATLTLTADNGMQFTSTRFMETLARLGNHAPPHGAILGLGAVCGSLYTKADAIKEAKSGPSLFESNRLNEIKIRFFDNVAVIQGNETFKRKDGQRGRFVWTDVMVKRNRGWQIVAAEDLIAPERPTPWFSARSVESRLEVAKMLPGVRVVSH